MNQQPTFNWQKPGDLNASTASSAFGRSGFNASQQQQQQQSQSQIQQQQQQVINNIAPSVMDQLRKIKESWDPQSPNCAFQHYFYSKVPADQALLYSKPPGQDQEKWDQAVANRPDSSSVPVLAVGFSDLQKRVELQANQVAAYRARMHEINDKLDELSTRHDLYTTVKTVEMKARYAKLVHRTLSLAAKIQVLKGRGYVLRPDEEVLKKKLEQLNYQIDDPAVYGRINEVWARMSVLREKARALKEQMTENNTPKFTLDWDRDDEQLEKLAKILKAQQTGIAFLAKILKTDTETVEKLIEQLEKDRSSKH